MIKWLRENYILGESRMGLKQAKDMADTIFDKGSIQGDSEALNVELQRILAVQGFFKNDIITIELESFVELKEINIWELIEKGAHGDEASALETCRLLYSGRASLGPTA